MPAWIHDRADHIRGKNPDMLESEAWAIATQQSHALGKSPKGYGTTTGRKKAKMKYKTPGDDVKTAMFHGFVDEFEKIAVSPEWIAKGIGSTAASIGSTPGFAQRIGRLAGVPSRMATNSMRNYQNVASMAKAGPAMQAGVERAGRLQSIAENQGAGIFRGVHRSTPVGSAAAGKITNMEAALKGMRQVVPPSLPAPNLQQVPQNIARQYGAS